MQTLTDIENSIHSHPAVTLYFSAPTCNVCHALKPKLFDALTRNFEQMRLISVDISETPEIASHFGVFTIPTLLVFLDGREFLRKSRHMSVGEVVEAIRRPYEIMLR
jgi:thioredoxin 1